MNKKISTPVAFIIIIACAIFVVGLAAWQYFYLPKIELSEITLSEKPASQAETTECVGKKGEYELRVYDSQGRVTGLINGEQKREIPNSSYFSEKIIPGVYGKIIPQEVIIFEPKDSYVYEIFGLTEGNYKLSPSFSQEGKKVIFSAINIPISPKVTHQYHFDWTLLAQGKDGATVFIDTDNDGVFEKTIKSDPTLNCEEFIELTK